MVERFYGPLTGFEMRPGERGDYVRYSDYAALEMQLAEARKALGEIEQEARSLPLHTSAVTWEHVLTSKLAVVRDAARRALEAQGGENGQA